CLCLVPQCPIILPSPAAQGPRPKGQVATFFKPEITLNSLSFATVLLCVSLTCFVFASLVAAVDSADAPLYLPYKALVSTISSMVFSEGEAHRLIEILSEKVGIIQDTWHMASQKGDPVAMLKKQLEEREKQLALEQEDASAAKNRLRELTKELSAEKSKVASVETRLSSQLSKREQEMIALQARMQASYQDHVAQTQGLNAKIVSLQDQLEKGPNAQLARLQQENSILRDALNQATSQAESKQNAELAKLRQECTKLTKELGEKTESLHADEIIRKGLEAKVSATEKQLSLLQASHGESEQALQRRLEEVCEELRVTQSKNNSLQATLDDAQQDSSKLSEFQVRIGRLEAEISEHSAQADALTTQLVETQAEKSQLVQQVASINALLEASQTKKEEDNSQVGHTFLAEKDTLVTSLQEELREVREKTTIDAVRLSIQTCVLSIETAFLLITFLIISSTSNWLQVFTQKAQEALSQQSQASQSSTALPELLEKLKEAEESHGTLQAECEQYRTVLAETEGMLKDLQKSVEEEELVWKSKMANSEEQLGVVSYNLKEQMMLLEAQLEKQSDNQGTSEEMEQVHEQVQSATSLELALLLKEIYVFFCASSPTKEVDLHIICIFKCIERLEKEKKLSKDLGQAATKLQQLLKATQEQLTKERDTVRTLQEHLEGKGEYVELKEGTSV
uniref:Ribosome binding protein 1a n=1 Tax=Sander lucioperca TaxID=283035 RepID=A0A8C9YRZ7_SANLU